MLKWTRFASPLLDAVCIGLVFASLLLNVAGIALAVRHEVAEQRKKIAPGNALAYHPFFRDWSDARFQTLRAPRGCIVFAGDSIPAALLAFELDRDHEGDADAAWHAALPDIRDRCIAGETAEGLLDREQNLIDLHPRQLFLWCGINDLTKDRPPSQVAQTYRQIIDRLKSGSPQTRIVVVALLPLGKPSTTAMNPIIGELNARLKTMASGEGVGFVDVGSAAQDATGQLDSSLAPDGIHPMGLGCVRLESRLAPLLDK
jgi:lysophospholipase L1-like esterase